MTVPPVAPDTPEDPLPKPAEGRGPERAGDSVPEPSSGRASKRITDKDLAQIAELLTDRRGQAAVGGAETPVAADPNMRESLLDNPKTLFGGVGGLAFFYAIGIYLAVHGSLFCVFFFAMALTYTALFAGMLTNSFRLAVGSFVAVGVLMVGWALVAVSFGAFHYALAVAAYGFWALVTTAAFWSGEDSMRIWVLTLVAHGLALAGFILVDAGWRVDSPVAGLSIAVSLALGYLALRARSSLKATPRRAGPT